MEGGFAEIDPDRLNLQGDDPPSGFLPTTIITLVGLLDGGPYHYRYCKSSWGSERFYEKVNAVGSIDPPNPLLPSDGRDWGQAHLADALLWRSSLPLFFDPAFPSTFPPFDHR